MKKGRKGEASLFTETQNGQMQLTEEAMTVCKFCGIDSKDLYPK